MRKKAKDEGRTVRGEGESRRNKDRGKHRVGGKQEEGDHSEGKEEDQEIIRDGCAFALERQRKKGEEGAGDRGGLSPFLHPTLRALLLDRDTSDQSCTPASAPVTELRRLAVPAKGWFPTEYAGDRVRTLGSL